MIERAGRHSIELQHSEGIITMVSCYFLDQRFKWLQEKFSAGKFKSVGCPKEGCMRQCLKKAERSTLRDQARQGYDVRLMEGAGVMPTLHPAPDTTATRTTPQKEG